jgi:hypothetical protein
MRAILETSNCENLLKILNISILLKKEKKIAYGECRKNFNDTVRFLVGHYPNVGFTKCKVKTVINLFEDTGSVRERPRVPKKAQFTHERVEYNVFWFDEPLKGSKSLKTFKINLTFRFDKL